MDTRLKQMLSNETGFSLIEIMIALVIMSVVGLGMSQMYINQAQEQKRAKIKNELNRLDMQVQAAAVDPVALGATYKAQKDDPTGGCGTGPFDVCATPTPTLTDTQTKQKVVTQ